MALYQRLATDRGSSTEADLQILATITDLFVRLDDADIANGFPPFAIMRAFLERLIASLRG